MILKFIWYIYVDKLVKGIIVLLINVFVCWSRIVVGFIFSCLIILIVKSSVFLNGYEEKIENINVGIFCCIVDI